jgi:hypothetical protein
MRQHVLDLDAAQQRPPRKEHPRVYRAVQQLRRQGIRVYRRGREHLVGSRQLTTRQMLSLAQQVGLAAALGLPRIA